MDFRLQASVAFDYGSLFPYATMSMSYGLRLSHVGLKLTSAMTTHCVLPRYYTTASHLALDHSGTMAGRGRHQMATHSLAAQYAARTKAVIFDVGGVMIPSPLPFLAEFEHRAGLPSGTFREAITGRDDNAWERMERGEISAEEFSRRFSDECSHIVGWKVDLTQFLGEFQGLPVYVHAELLSAVHCLRAEGIKTALLTNNFLTAPGSQSHHVSLLSPHLFDVVVESSKVRMRKPERRIYEHTLTALDVAPHEAVFLDDLGVNLKPAKQLGIRTIKVSDAQQAVRELEDEVGFCLRGYVPGTSLVPDRLQIDVNKLTDYLRQTLALTSEEAPIVRCFEHGQSNPTYSIVYAGRTLVLRKKPPGKLLSSAHAVDREYRVMKAVSQHGVPVPNMLALCQDDRVSRYQNGQANRPVVDFTEARDVGGSGSDDPTGTNAAPTRSPPPLHTLL